MPIGVSNFQILDPQQANPFMYGIQQGLAARLNALQAQKAQEELPYAGGIQREALQKAIYENMIQKPYAENAVPFEQAALLKAQAEPKEMAARTGLYGAQTGLTQQQAREIDYKIKNGLLYPEQIQMMRQFPQFIDSLMQMGGGQQAAQPQPPTYGYSPIPNMPGMQAPSAPNAPVTNQSMQQMVNALQSALPQQNYTPINDGKLHDIMPGKMTPRYQGDVMAQLQNMMTTGEAPLINQTRPVQSQQELLNQAIQTAMQQAPQTSSSIPQFQQAGYTPIQDANQLMQSIAAQQSQQTPAQQQMAGGQDVIPGTNITRQEAVNAMVSKILGIPLASKPDPETVRWHDAQLKLQEQRQRAASFRAMPANMRAADVAAVEPMVGNYNKATQLLMDGKSVDEIANEYGYTDPSKRPLPKLPATTKTVNDQQRSQMGRAVFEAITPMIQKDTATYPDTILGYSPKMIGDLVAGKNEVEAGNALAAVAATTEASSAINSATGMTPGFGLTKYMGDKLLSNLKVPGFVITPKMKQAFYERLEQYNRSIQYARNYEFNMMFPTGQPEKLPEMEQPQAGDLVYNPDTGMVE